MDLSCVIMHLQESQHLNVVAPIPFTVSKNKYILLFEILIFPVPSKHLFSQISFVCFMNYAKTKNLYILIPYFQTSLILFIFVFQYLVILQFSIEIFSVRHSLI